jgi:hypothetical protein
MEMHLLTFFPTPVKRFALLLRHQAVLPRLQMVLLFHQMVIPLPQMVVQFFIISHPLLSKLLYFWKFL